MQSAILALVAIFIFPGFLFLSSYGLAAEFVDRKLHARLQNRVGPPWFQPFADFVKLLAKETIIPNEVDPGLFAFLPVVAMAAVVAAFLYIPLWSITGLASFEGDLVVVIYLLTIPTLTFFLAGWGSTSLYSMIGAIRSATQLFAYEVPLYMAVLAPALLAGSWSFKGIGAFYADHPGLFLVNLPAMAVALVALQGKLEKVPFDMPEAETEIVGGTFTEYSGRLLAFFRMALDMELIVGASLVAAVFLPFGLSWHPVVGFALYILKTLGIIVLLTVFRSIMARLRTEQMLDFCWKYLIPAAMAQLVINVLLNALVLA